MIDALIAESETLKVPNAAVVVIATAPKSNVTEETIKSALAGVEIIVITGTTIKSLTEKVLVAAVVNIVATGIIVISLTVMVIIFEVENIVCEGIRLGACAKNIPSTLVAKISTLP